MAGIDTIKQEIFASGGHIDDLDISQGEKLKSRAVSDLGANIGFLGERLNTLRLQQEKIEDMQFESEVQRFDTEYKNNLNNSDWGKVSADKEIENYKAGLDKLGKERLGQSGYERWTKNRGYGFKENAALGLTEFIANGKDKFNYEKVNELAAEKAVLALNNPASAEAAKNDFFMTVDEMIGNPVYREKIKQNFKTEYSLALALRDLDSDPESAKAKLKDPKAYEGLGVVQRERLLKHAEVNIKAVQGTVFEKKIKAQAQKWLELYNNDFEKAVAFYDNYGKTLNDKQGTPDGLSREEAMSFFNFMDGVLGSDVTYLSAQTAQKRELAIANEMNFQEFKKDFNAFAWDKQSGRAKNKDLANVKNIIGHIENIDNMLRDSSFGEKHQSDLLQMRADFAFELGEMIVNDEDNLTDMGKKIKTEKKDQEDLTEGKVKAGEYDFVGKAFSKQVFDKLPGVDLQKIPYKPKDYSNEAYLRKYLNEQTKQWAGLGIIGGGDEKAGAKELGLIYQAAYRTARQRGINLEQASYDGKMALREIVTNLLKGSIKAQNNLPEDNYQAAIIEGKIVKLNKENGGANPNAGVYDIDEYTKGI